MSPGGTSAFPDVDIHYSQLTLPFAGHDYFHGPSEIIRYSMNHQDFISLDPSAGDESTPRLSAAKLYSINKLQNAIVCFLKSI